MFSINRARILATFFSLLLLISAQPASSKSAAGRMNLVNGSFTVEPGHYRSWQFSLDSNGGVVQGRFRAEGGSGNDIEVYIFDADGFENFQNGHRAPTYYNSGRVTVGTINVRLKGGEYYLVFSNSFSALSNKAVTANVSVE